MEIIVNLLPLAIAAALVPLHTFMTLLLLKGEGGVVKASAFVGGLLTVRAAQGILFGLIVGAAGEAGGKGRVAIISSTLLVVLGILLLIAAYKTWRKEDDPDEPPKWMSSITNVDVPKAFGVGMLLMLIAAKQWVLTLSVISTIREAQPGQPAGILLYVLYMLLAQSLVLVVVGAAVFAPQKAGGFINRLYGLLERNSRTITIALSLIFGVWFVWRGINGLLG